MAIPLIPWEPSNIPDELQAELNRRKVNRSFTYVNGSMGGWDNKVQQDGDWNKYKGPMVPWVRFCSNSVGREWEKNLDADGNRVPLKTGIKEGFVFSGGKNFYNGYGFSKTSGNSSPESIIGYLPNGIDTHTISNDIKTSNYPIHVPAPEIEKISVTIQKELYRRATVEWVCFSKAQLEYMTPYFLVPGISCILEWGWNHFNPECLIDLTDTEQLKRLNNNPYPLYTEHILKSKGNYDVLFGRITHFEWEVDGNKFKCKTEITSQDRIYAGLVVDSTSVVKTENANGNEKDIRPFGSLLEFVEKKLPLFKNVATAPGGDPANITDIADVVNYIKRHYPSSGPNAKKSNITWEDYVYGVFYGRDKEDIKNPSSDDNKKEDFDRKSDMIETWLNLGLVMEIINYHVQSIKSFGNQAEIFRVDIDDVVITAHPNLISNDGTVLLIPNSAAPKYFSGIYGYQPFGKQSQSTEDYAVLMNSTVLPIKPITDYKTAKKNKMLADYRLKKLCGQSVGAHRDNLDELINRVRYENVVSNSREYAFPYAYDRHPEQGSKPYPAKFSGNLKDLYVNTAFLKSLIEDDGVKTYTNLIEKLMTGISNAAGGFWDFRLVSGTGRAGQLTTEPATMKIVDYKFVNTANTGTPFSFDYFDSDSLLLGIGFKPTLSNAQAIRTIYAQTNQPDRTVSVVNGDNELLDYKFRDRLAKDDVMKTASAPATRDTQFQETLRELQQLSPPPGAYQMTMRVNGKIVIRRLALPSASDVLKALLDDGDEENNPKYTGIMPGIQATFTIQGIGGLRTFMMFLVRNLPEPYSHENIIFRIVDVQESIEASKWITTITAGIIPLRDNIRTRLGIPVSKTN